MAAFSNQLTRLTVAVAVAVASLTKKGQAAEKEQKIMIL
jgi:hypothetical protein